MAEKLGYSEGAANRDLNAKNIRRLADNQLLRLINNWLRVENNVDNEEIACYKKFLHFPQCFPKLYSGEGSKGVCVGMGYWAGLISIYEIFPQVFEGGKLVIGKGLSSHFQINHTLTLANPMSSGYRFGATFVGTKQFGPQESYPVLLGDIDASGSLNANIIHAFRPNLLSRFVAQGEKCNTQLVTDYKGSSYTASVTVANPDLLNSSGLVVSQFLQRVTPSVDIGAECMYQRGGHIPGGQIAIMALGARIQGEKWQLSANASPSDQGAVHASFFQKINDTLSIGAEFETSVAMGTTSATVGYQCEVPPANVTFKGQIDTNLTVQATLEKKFIEAGVPFTFLLSAMGNPLKSDYKFGIGMMLG